MRQVLRFEYSYANLVNGELWPEFLERHRARPAKSIADIGHAPNVIRICLNCRLFVSGCIRNTTARNLYLGRHNTRYYVLAGIFKILKFSIFLYGREIPSARIFYSFCLKCYLFSNCEQNIFFYTLNFFLNIIQNKFFFYIWTFVI